MADKQDDTTFKVKGHQAATISSVAYRNLIADNGYCPQHGEWSGLEKRRCPSCEYITAVTDLVKQDPGAKDDSL
jgi:hypothetical protein